MGNNRTDSLISGAVRAINGSGGSAKTAYNHQKEAERFVATLRDKGFGVQQWSNITNKHVQAVVSAWKEEGKAASTIKEYLSGVRVCANFYGNEKVSGENKTFGIENRIYVNNADKSLSQEQYEKVVAELKASPDVNDHRIAAQLQLQRELGLRKEESFKFNPGKAVLQDGRVYISYGTKGGRERMLHEISHAGREAIEYARSVASGGNTMPKNKTERQWEGKFYRVLRSHGINKKNGASAHGNRHYHAQERYQKLTGFSAPCKFASKAEFKESAMKIAGENWKQIDRDARLQLKAELGHGPDRDDVVSQYLGSHHR